ncbi:MAG: stage 0 sporulation protein [Candidatus Omnitrophica bacterium]|nr:stage 0 sporulation protein [Candidatus Omnitrophota bacterium]
MKVVEVSLREAGKTAPHDADELELHIGDVVIVEAERGIDYGVVRSPDKEVKFVSPVGHPRKILRKANEQDLRQIEDNRERIRKPFGICEKKIKGFGLDMKLIHAEYSFDRGKIIFYFTSAGRVDFRDLVKELARIFGVRIELRQIGARDETKLHGGCGICGRPLCCQSFLQDFDAISIRMAKDQHLPLNQDQLSGICGRLKCCLSYEHGLYKQLAQGLPKEGQQMKVEDEVGKVVSVEVLKGTFTVRLPSGKEVVMDRRHYKGAK